MQELQDRGEKVASGLPPILAQTRYHVIITNRPSPLDLGNCKATTSKDRGYAHFA
jgi:hypothetical protein